MSRGTWSREERAELAAAYNQAHAALKTAAFELDVAAETQQEALGLLSNALDHQVFQLARAYLDGLPRQAMARCPYTDAVSRVSFDPLGLDGPFWQIDDPIRPKAEPEAGAHFIGITGAMRLGGAVEDTSFLVTPGPGAPYVIPRLFERQEVIAVLSEGHVGVHLAYAVSYFAAEPKHAHRRPRMWGTRLRMTHAPPDPDLPETEKVADYDFDLKPWLESRRLAWVSPGDHDRILRYGVEGCPYLDLPGPHALQYVQYGKTW